MALITAPTLRANTAEEALAELAELYRIKTKEELTRRDGVGNRRLAEYAVADTRAAVYKEVADFLGSLTLDLGD